MNKRKHRRTPFDREEILDSVDEKKRLLKRAIFQPQASAYMQICQECKWS